MYAKYQEEFIRQVKGNSKYIYMACFEKINKLLNSVDEWTNEDFDKLLESMESISANSIRRYIAIFREIHKFICEKEGLEYKALTPTKPVFAYISYERLRSRILTYKDYIQIRDLLTFENEGQIYNYRDKIMFELAFEGLSNSEIRYLKEEDIHFERDEQGKCNRVKLHIKDGRCLIVDDETVIHDLNAGMKEELYARADKNGKVLLYPYRSSKYLIKPIAITKKKRHCDDDSVSNPSLMLRNILNKLDENIISRDNDGSECIIDLNNLNLEDIRRSKIIYMLALNKYLSVVDIARLFGKSVECDYYWLKEIGNRVYS